MSLLVLCVVMYLHLTGKFRLLHDKGRNLTQMDNLFEPCTVLYIVTSNLTAQFHSRQQRFNIHLQFCTCNLKELHCICAIR